VANWPTISGPTALEFPRPGKEKKWRISGDNHAQGYDMKRGKAMEKEWKSRTRTCLIR